VQTPFDERNAEVSPSGRLIAYQSDESGRDEIAAPRQILVVQNWFEELKRRVPTP